MASQNAAYSHQVIIQLFYGHFVKLFDFQFAIRF